jgi:putative ABC transport system substrate-binding protein
MLGRNAQRIATLALGQKLPTIFAQPNAADRGGLMTYGVNSFHMARRAATFVDKIFKGAKPGDLPIEQPTDFSLVVNLKTARTLGITIPRAVLLQASRVIE